MSLFNVFHVEQAQHLLGAFRAREGQHLACRRRHLDLAPRQGRRTLAQGDQGLGEGQG